MVSLRDPNSFHCTCFFFLIEYFTYWWVKNFLYILDTSPLPDLIVCKYLLSGERCSYHPRLCLLRRRQKCYPDSSFIPSIAVTGVITLSPGFGAWPTWGYHFSCYFTETLWSLCVLRIQKLPKKPLFTEKNSKVGILNFNCCSNQWVCN